MAARAKWIFGLILLGLAACGGNEIAYRPLNLTLDRFSSQTQTLVVKVFPSTAQSCNGVVLDSVQMLNPENPEWTQRWMRGDPRTLQLPRIDEPTITVIAYGEDSGGSPIQFACLGIDYIDIESPEVTLVLSM